MLFDPGPPIDSLACNLGRSTEAPSGRARVDALFLGWSYRLGANH
jgi:hypothetical protein